MHWNFTNSKTKTKTKNKTSKKKKKKKKKNHLIDVMAQTMENDDFLTFFHCNV